MNWKDLPLGCVITRKRYSISHVIKHTQQAMRYLFMLPTVANCQKYRKLNNLGRIRTLCTLLVGISIQLLSKHLLAVVLSQKVKNKIIIQCSNTTSEYFRTESRALEIFSHPYSQQHHLQQLQARCSLGVHPEDEQESNICSLCHRTTAVICCDINEPKASHKKTCHLHRLVLRIVGTMETGSGKVSAGSWGKREHRCLMGLEFQSYSPKGYGEGGRSDCCTNLKTWPANIVKMTFFRCYQESLSQKNKMEPGSGITHL